MVNKKTMELMRRKKKRIVKRDTKKAKELMKRDTKNAKEGVESVTTKIEKTERVQVEHKYITTMKITAAMKLITRQLI